MFMKEFLKAVDISKNRLLRAERAGTTFGKMVTDTDFPYRLFNEGDVAAAREFFHERPQAVSLYPRGDEVEPHPQYFRIGEACKKMGITEKTLVEKEKKGIFPPPKWTRKPFPARVYSWPDMRRIMALHHDEATAATWLVASQPLGVENVDETEKVNPSSATVNLFEDEDDDH